MYKRVVDKTARRANSLLGFGLAFFPGIGVVLSLVYLKSKLHPYLAMLIGGGTGISLAFLLSILYKKISYKRNK